MTKNLRHLSTKSELTFGTNHNIRNYYKAISNFDRTSHVIQVKQYFPEREPNKRTCHKTTSQAKVVLIT